jgi:ABC-2 type transport system permease protein
MPARNLLAGKIAGIGLLGLGQIVATAIVALVAASLVDSFDVPAVRGSVLAWAVVWFVLGYGLYATVFGTLGSLASRTEDASSVTGPVSILLVLGFLVSFAAIGSADTTWAQLVSWFPITAPLAMPNRIAMGVATWWDPLVAVFLTLATIAGLVVLGGRIYTRAILHTGATLSLGEAWRGAPLPTHQDVPVTTESTERKEEPAVTQPTTREARTQLVLTVIGIAVGGIMFALTGDFVLGVGVGAVVFTLARQAMKIWGRKTDHQVNTASEPDREPAHR